jgi:membrane-associated protein
MSHVITLLQQYKYIILLPIAILEGPIITIIAGFLVSMGQLNAFLVFPLVVAGDAIGDGCCYLIGRFGHGIVRNYGPKFGVTPKKITAVKHYFHTHRKKALFLSKVLHGIGFTGLIVAGSLKIPYSKFFLTCFLTTLAQSFLFLMIGILFGHAYDQIGQYLNYYAAGSTIVALCIGGFLLVRQFNCYIRTKLI